MLTETQKIEIRSECYRGDPASYLDRLRTERSSAYLESSHFAIDVLRRMHTVPENKHCAFLVRFDRFKGTLIEPGPWRDDGSSWIMSEVSGIRHPEPLAAEPAVATVKGETGSHAQTNR